MGRARQFIEAGWSNVSIVDGGILAWISEDLPLAPRIPAPDAEARDTGIFWSADLEEARRLSAERGKPLVTCFVAAWCDACRRFRNETLASPEITSLAGRFLWVMLEVDRDISAVRRHKIRVTPTTDLVDLRGTTRVRISGHVTAGEFRKLLEEFERDSRAVPGPRDRLEIGSTGGPAVTEIPQGFRGTGICFSNVGYGPLRLPSQSPFQSLRYGLMPRTPSTLAEGFFEARWTETWVNLWAIDAGEHLVDFEMLQSSFSLAYGLSDVLQIEVGFVQKSRFGGVMDGFIQDFHDLFGIDQGGRDDAEKGGFALQVDREDGTTAVRLDPGDRGSFSESLLATLQHNVTCGTDVLPAFAYALTVRRELGDQEDMPDAESVDLAASVSLSKRFGDFYGYVSVGYAWFGKERFEGVELRATQLSGLVALEWQVGAGASLVVQYLISEGVAEDLREFSEASYEVTFGGKFEVAPMTVLEIGLVENVVTFDNSPDFGIHAGLLRRF